MRIELARDRHLAVARLHAAAGKHQLAGHEFQAGVALAEQHLRQRAGAVDDDQRRGIARLQVRMALVALDLGEALGEVSHSSLRRLACFDFDFGRSKRLPRRGRASATLLIAPFGQKLESQRAGDRRGLDQLDGDACRRADSSRRCGRRSARGAPRDSGSSRRRSVRAGMKPSAPVSSSFTNRPARVTPLMRPAKVAPMRSARKCAISRSTVSRSAFMARRSAAEMRAAISPSAACVHAARQAVGAEILRADQRAMHHQVGVAADRRGEVRIAAQIEPEMAVVLRRVFGLRLGAQHHLVDQLLVLGAAHARQNLVEVARGASPGPWPDVMSSVARNSRNASIFSGEGSSCTR